MGLPPVKWPSLCHPREKLFYVQTNPLHHYHMRYLPLFQHISNPNPNVNSHFSHRQGRMTSVCACVFVCVFRGGWMWAVVVVVVGGQVVP